MVGAESWFFRTVSNKLVTYVDEKRFDNRIFRPWQLQFLTSGDIPRRLLYRTGLCKCADGPRARAFLPVHVRGHNYVRHPGLNFVEIPFVQAKIDIDRTTFGVSGSAFSHQLLTGDPFAQNTIHKSDDMRDGVAS